MLRPRHIGLIVILLILILVIYVTRSTTGGGGSGGAPTDAQYVTLATNATLTQERVLTGTTNQVTVTDNGAGSTVVLSLPQDIDTDADVTFGTGTFNSPADAASAAIIAQNAVDATLNLIMQLRGPDKVTPAANDTIFMSFYQEITSGFVETGRIDNFLSNVGALSESSIRFRVLDSGSLQLSMILENDDVALTRNGGSYRLRSTDGITVDIQASAQTAASTVFLTIPDAGDTNDVFVLQDAIQTITGKTLDGDNNTFVDISPDSFDNLDSPVDGECATYNTGQIEWVACGGTTINADLLVPSGSSPTTTAYVGIPNTTFYSTADVFVTANDIQVSLFPVTEDININQVSFEVTGTPGNPGDACRIGLYEITTNWQIGALVVDWGQVVNDSSGWKNTTVDTDITAGDYATVMLCDSGPSIRFHNSATYHSFGIINTGTTSTTRFAARLRVSAPTAGQFAGGFADPGDDWDTIDLIAVGGNQHALILRWTVS